MEGGCAVTLSSPKTHLPNNLLNPYISSSSSSSTHRHNPRIISFLLRRPPSKSQILLPNPRNSRHSLEPLSAIAQVVEPALETSNPSKEVSRKVDKSGRFCSPRAARELALLISYAACLEGCDPVRLFDKRVNAKRYPGYVFDKTSLLDYDHMSFGGAPVEAGTQEEAEELMRKNEKESTNEAEVLSAPPKLVYNNFVLRLAREILTAVVDRWNDHVLVIDRIIPPNWKDEPAARILELCILHLAMGEITTVGTRHQIVINEAVDLAKRFCDGCAPRVINGCLRTFVKDYSATQTVQP